MRSLFNRSSRAQQQMKHFADKKRSFRTFAIGDCVPQITALCSNFCGCRANHKLAFKYFGPFQITAQIGTVAYKLQLPPTSSIHPVFMCLNWNLLLVLQDMFSLIAIVYLGLASSLVHSTGGLLRRVILLSLKFWCVVESLRRCHLGRLWRIACSISLHWLGASQFSRVGLSGLSTQRKVVPLAGRIECEEEEDVRLLKRHLHGNGHRPFGA